MPDPKTIPGTIILCVTVIPLGVVLLGGVLAAVDKVKRIYANTKQR